MCRRGQVRPRVRLDHATCSRRPNHRLGNRSHNPLAHNIQRAGELAKIGFPVHPHMLRHACGYKLANDGQDTRAIQHYLGHKNIQHTVLYTQLSPERFRNFWKD